MRHVQNIWGHNNPKTTENRNKRNAFIQLGLILTEPHSQEIRFDYI